MESQTEQDGFILKKRGKSSIIAFFVLISTLIFPGKLVGHDDDIKFEHISIEEGLSQSSVFCIFQDSRGFMWFGTENGLNRYNGHTFKVFEESKGSYSLSNNLVRAICEDKSGKLWVGTWGGGLNKLNRAKGEFETYKNSPDDPNSLSNNNVMSIYKDKFGILWIGTDDGLNRYNQKSDNFTNYKNNFGYFKGKVRAIYEDKDGILWIGTDEGLKKYNKKEDNFLPYKIDPDDSFCNKVRAICEDKHRVLWIGTERGLYEFNRVDEEFVPYHKIINYREKLLNDKNISSICEDRKHMLWIGTRGNGIFRFDSIGEKITNHLYIPTDSNSLSHDDVRAIYEDKSGLIWIGTFGGGINKFDRNKRKKFNLYRNIPGNPNSLSNNNVMVIRKGNRNGKIWIGTRGGGIAEFNHESKTFTNYVIGLDVSNNPYRNDVRALDEDHLGILWVGTVRAGLYKFNPKEKRFYPYKNIYIGEEEYILSIFKDKADVLWIGTLDGGLIKIDKDRKKEAKRYKNIHGDENSLSNDKIYSIYEDKAGILWIGTGGGGLNKFDREKETFTSYTSKKGRIRLSHNFVIAIFEDKEGILWIGTNGGGLNKSDKNKETFKVYTTKDGLPNNVIYDILEDDSGCIWISTNRGLSKLNPKTEEFRNYTISDGLQGYEFNRNAAFKSDNGEIFFGGLNGFNVFAPKEIKYNQYEPPIVITSFNSNNPVNLGTSILEINELELSYKNTFISFEFAALSFSDPERNQYAYKLEPINHDWIPLGNQHHVVLTNLKPGEYTFMVRGSNNNGVWNKEGKSIRIIIKPPFWTRWWFISLCVVFFGSIILGLNRTRIRSIVKIRKKPTDLSEILINPDAFTEIVTQNRDMQNIFKYIESIATSDLPVLITGDTGTGKELIARAIHKASGREGKFIARNIAVMDDALFSEQLFGNEKGLDTDVRQKGKGWIEEAKNGILFLDEIGDISLQSQVKLLGLIPEREFVSPGTETQLPTDVRLIVATNKELKILMKEGKFRKDLYYRLIHKIHLPPLRERKDDIPILVDHFIKKSATLLNKNVPRVPKELFTLLSDYDFPGNVRELAGIVYDAMNSHQSGDLSLDVFREKIKGQSGN
jgi:ligand-binding sensor domain-containing protein